MRFFGVSGGETGIRTPGTVITVHMISNHAPSASSDISPLYNFRCLTGTSILYNTCPKKSSINSKFVEIHSFYQ